MAMENYNFKSSNSYVEVFDISPTKSGILDGLTFGVKDNIDVAGYKTAYGSPAWRDCHPVAVCHAVCVEQILAAGATCNGKHATDELTFSLDGENHFYGTPVNPKAPDRIPGGSSNGSASAVACGLADFSIATDNGGSIRVPSNNCGVFGMRPSHDVVSTQGVAPFAPSTDTVGIIARSSKILSMASSVLLSHDLPKYTGVGNVYILKDVFDMVDPEVKSTLENTMQDITNDIFSSSVEEIKLKDIVGGGNLSDLSSWFDQIFRVVQWGEIWGSLGSWVENDKPELGPRTKVTLSNAKALDRTLIGNARYLREKCFTKLEEFLSPTDIIIMPTTPGLPPLKGSIGADMMKDSTYYPHTSAITSFAGVAQLPQASIPAAETAEGIPVGLSILARNREDTFLLGVVEHLSKQLGIEPSK
ncbi:glutamyl-tRNA(Gln) amidotransferase subunit A [Legionella nautarum]|uniref:Glutamyl-tRNA(Gln) amidotransferase subunit A n=1 Tax=Legionella nautarum TaxID=45070 RepID=A0A0W0WWV3_9GAMM|nr:amidase family protein [Legionella nautarum]KTD36795.1 glutamyl-tRNA(Gln) amidotransferase subunit A [Legionella nautarum]